MYTIDEIKMGMSTFFNPVLSNTKKNPTLQQWPKTMKERTDSGNYREGKRRCSRSPSHQKAASGNPKLNSVSHFTTGKSVSNAM